MYHVSCTEIIIERFIFVQSVAVRNLIWFEKYPEYGMSNFQVNSHNIE